MSALTALLAEYTPNDMIISLVDVSEGRPSTTKYPSPTVTKFLSESGLSLAQVTCSCILPIPRTDYYCFVALYCDDKIKLKNACRFTRNVLISQFTLIAVDLIKDDSIDINMEQAVDFASNWVFPGLFKDASFWYELTDTTAEVEKVPATALRTGPLNAVAVQVSNNANMSSSRANASLSPLPLTRPRGQAFSLKV